MIFIAHLVVKLNILMFFYVSLIGIFILFYMLDPPPINYYYSSMWYECHTTSKEDANFKQVFLINVEHGDCNSEALAIDYCNDSFPNWDCYKAVPTEEVE